MELMDIKVLEKIHHFSTQWLQFLFYFMCEESKAKVFLVSHLQIWEQNLTRSPELTAKNTRFLRKWKAETIWTSGRKKERTEAMTGLWTFRSLKCNLCCCQTQLHKGRLKRCWEVLGWQSVFIGSKVCIWILYMRIMYILYHI